MWIRIYGKENNNKLHRDLTLDPTDNLCQYLLATNSNLLFFYLLLLVEGKNKTPTNNAMELTMKTTVMQICSISTHECDRQWSRTLEKITTAMYLHTSLKVWKKSVKS